jgi:hypothetical protein
MSSKHVEEFSPADIAHMEAAYSSDNNNLVAIRGTKRQCEAQVCTYSVVLCVILQIEQLTQLIANIEIELEKCRLDVDGMAKQEAQLRFHLAYICIITHRQAATG